MSKIFGKKLKIVRKECGLTQEDFAQTLNISRAYLAKLESGHSSPSNLFVETISLRFKIPRDWLLDESLADAPLPEDIDFIDTSILCKYNILDNEYKKTYITSY